MIRTDRFSNDNAKSVGDKRRRMKSCFGGDKHPVALAMSVLVETNTNSSKKGQIGEKFWPEQAKHDHILASSQVDLILVVLFLSVIIWTTGATVFSYCEHWEFFDALYFCFATLTTIGEELSTLGLYYQAIINKLSVASSIIGYCVFQALVTWWPSSRISPWRPTPYTSSSLSSSSSSASPSLQPSST